MSTKYESVKQAIWYSTMQSLLYDKENREVRNNTSYILNIITGSVTRINRSTHNVIWDSMGFNEEDYR